MALPLEGVRVLDLTSVMAGPYCTMVLGDMGAEVIKIENFPEGDASRRFDPKVNDESYCFAVLNRNKKSVGLNMKDPRGREAFMKLAAKADIITENFRPGVVKKLGIDYDADQSSSIPGVIYASMSGFGQTGSLRQERRLRHRRARHVGHHDDDRLSRRQAGQSRNRDERHRERRHGALQHPRRVHREAPHRQRPVPRDFAARSGACVDALGIGRVLRLRRAADRDRHAPSPLDALPGCTRRRTATSPSAATTTSCGPLSARASAANPNGWPIRASIRSRSA